MKKKIILLPFVAAILYVTLSSNATGPGHTSGRDATGAAGTAGCTGSGCHSATANPAVNVSIELDSAGVPVSHYVAGLTYTIKITGINNTTDSLPRFGFQLEAVKLAGAGTGSAVNAGVIATTGLPAFCQNTNLGGRHLVEHSNRLAPLSGTGTTGTVYTETISWTAPLTAGTGSVKIFGTLNAVNADLASSGDSWNNASQLISESLAPINGKPNLCMGDTMTMTDPVAGGVWSSTAPAVASVNPATGLVTGIQQGSADIVYTVGLTSDTLEISVFAPPGPIQGNVTMCNVGSVITITDSAIGGVWSGGTIGIATIDYLSGIVTSGFVAGNTVVTYSTGCGTEAYATITVNPPSAPIDGNVPMCTGGSPITLSDSTGGGLWSGGTWVGGTEAIATVDYLTGICTPGTTAGTSVLTYTSVCGTQVYTTITVNAAPAGITGNTILCTDGSSIVLSNTSFGGIWTGGTTGIAAIDSISGTVTPGGTTGTTVVTYSNGCGSDVYATLTVNTIPVVSAISGPHTFCVTTYIHLTDPTLHGVWSSNNPSALPMDTLGHVFGILAETGTVSYTVANSCGSASSTYDITVNPTPNPGTISSSAPGVCAGMTTTFSDVVLGGVWSFNTPAIATLDSSTGIMNPITPGVGTISYTVTNGCGHSSATSVITINSALLPGTISGDTAICVNGSGTLNETVGGGVWNSSDNTIVAIDGAAGTIAGLTSGSVNITYTMSSSCGSVSTVQFVTVNPLADVGTITGPGFVCDAATITLTDTASGGSWSSSDITKAGVDPATGVVTGVAGGTAILSYNVTNVCGMNSAIFEVTINPLPDVSAITGSSVVCLANTGSFSDTASGGKWTSSDETTLSIDTLSGVATGMATGDALLSYTVLNSCGPTTVTLSVQVLTIPVGVTISGPLTVCEGSSELLTGSPSGGSWYVWNSNADATGGTLTGYIAGTDSVYYSFSNGCGNMTVSEEVTVNPLPVAGAIVGDNNFCVGTTLTLSDASPGGVWSSAFGYAAVTGPGFLSGVSPGTDSILYTVTNMCGAISTYMILTVNPEPVAGIITTATGPFFEVCVGQNLDLLESTAGGIWSASNGNATVNDSGKVFGVTAGTDSITYTATTVCGSAQISKVVTINPLPALATITGADSMCSGNIDSLGTSIPGGVWSGSNAILATIDSTGRVHGMTSGLDTVIYTLTNGCGNTSAFFALQVLTLPNPGTIVAPDSLCSGASVTLNDTITGGVWSDTSSTIASVAGNVLTGLTGGYELIKYTVMNMCGSSLATHQIYIKPMPVAGIIYGPSSVCIGSADTLNETVPGGMWVSQDTTIAKINSTGIVHGMMTGSDSIFYQVTNECGTRQTGIYFAVDTAIALSVNGSLLVCNGGIYYKDTLAGSPVGGVWSSSVAVDSVNGYGVFFGNIAGNAVITYSLFNSCGTFRATLTLNVLPMPAPGNINGSTYNVCVGSSLTYSDTTAGGVWDIQNANATMSGISGNAVVTGVTPGADILSYAVTNICGTTTVTKDLTVNAVPVPVIVPSSDSAHLKTSPGYVSYQWYLAGSAIPGATDSVYTPVDTGRFTVEVTDGAGCSGMSATCWISKLGVNEVGNDGGNVQVYPNPTGGILFVKTDHDADVILSAVDGRIIKSMRNVSRMDISDLPTGIYFIRVTDRASGMVLRIFRVEKTNQ